MIVIISKVSIMRGVDVVSLSMSSLIAGGSKAKFVLMTKENQVLRTFDGRHLVIPFGPWNSDKERLAFERKMTKDFADLWSFVDGLKPAERPYDWPYLNDLFFETES